MSDPDGPDPRPHPAASFFRNRGVEDLARELVDGPRPVEAGMRVGPFTLTRFLARGGMGQVWVAEDRELRRSVALKLVLPEVYDPRTLELFAREARAGGRTAHRNLVTTLAYGTDEGLAWIAQELVEGSWTLKDLLDDLRASNQVPKDYYRLVATFVAQVADGLQAAHDAGVVHRDIKPQNILIAPDDTPKVTDFGLARVTDDSFRSQTGDFAGTWAYMSPEQVTAKRMGLDHRTDIFSLGVVLYEMLTLRRPFEGDTTHQIAESIIAYEPPIPSRIRSQCPRELSLICAKALQKLPSRRYESAAAFAADLRSFLGNEPIRATAPTRMEIASKWCRRHPVVSSVVALGTVATLTITLLAVQAVNKATEARENAAESLRAQGEAEERAVAATLLAAQSFLDSGSIMGAARLHRSVPEEHRDRFEWRALDSQFLEPTWQRPHDESSAKLSTLAFSPNDNLLAWGDQSGWVSIREGRNPYAERTRFRASDEWLEAIAWSRDGSYVATLANDSLSIWELPLCTPVPVEGLLDSDRIQDLSWSPTDDRLALAADDVLVLEPGDGDVFRLASRGPVQYGTYEIAWNPEGNKLAAITAGCLVLFDEEGQREEFLEGHEESAIRGISWEPDGKSIMFSWGNNVLNERDHLPIYRRWLDQDSGRLLTEGFPQDLECQTGLSSGGQLLGFSDGSLRYVGPYPGQAKYPVPSTSAVVEIAETSGGGRILSLHMDGSLNEWSLDAIRSPSMFDAPMLKQEGGPSLSRIGMRETTWSPNSLVLLWNGWSGTQVWDMSGDPRPVGLCYGVEAASWSTSGLRVAVSRDTGPLEIYDLATSCDTPILILQGASTSRRLDPERFSWSPDGVRFAAILEGGVLVVDLEGPVTERRIEVAEEGITSCRWLGDGESLVVNTREHGPQVLHLRTGERSDLPHPPVKDLSDLHTRPHPTLPLVCISSPDSEMRIHDVESGWTRSIQFPSLDFDELAWHPSDALLATADYSGTVHLWRPTLMGGTPVLQLAEELTGPRDLTWSQDGRHLAATEGLFNVEVYLDIWPSPQAAKSVPRGDRLPITPPSAEWVEFDSYSAMQDAITRMNLSDEEARSRSADALAACVLRALSAPD